MMETPEQVATGLYNILGAFAQSRVDGTLDDDPAWIAECVEPLIRQAIVVLRQRPVMATCDRPNELSERAWMERYKRRFIERAGLTESQAEACANAEAFAVLSDMFEDDPEGAADEEMSYWSD